MFDLFGYLLVELLGIVPNAIGDLIIILLLGLVNIGPFLVCCVPVVIFIRMDLLKINDRNEVNKRLLIYMILISILICCLHLGWVVYLKPYLEHIGAKLFQPAKILWQTSEYIDFIILIFIMINIGVNYKILKKKNGLQ